MKFSLLSERLFGEKAKFSYLLLASVLMLFTLLEARELWTQEHRWADIVSGMFYRHDFLHPYLGENRYYDKPLLSYWFIVLVAEIQGALTSFALRLPSALSALLAVWSIYRLGTKLQTKQLGLLSGWLLVTTFYFVFWARVSSADMLNLAGSLLAVTWYMEKREQAGFINYAVFFMIVALTSLCKGLVGAIVPCIAVLTDIALRHSWKKYLHLSFFLAFLPAFILYLIPFLASSYIGNGAYHENGLYLVYRENILRYFHPFDHRGPIYTYFLYLPIYLMPWGLFLIPALFSLKKRWLRLSLESKWLSFSLFFIFLFFTLSGSRRSYYILPLVPFALLFIADYFLTLKAKWLSLSAFVVMCSFILLFLSLDLLPAWYYQYAGIGRFARAVRQEVTKTMPWDAAQVVMLDGESKLNFYLGLAPESKHFNINHERKEQTAQSLLAAWPILMHKPANTIFITRKLYVAALQPYFSGYRKVEVPLQAPFAFLNKIIIKSDTNTPIAFIPDKFILSSDFMSAPPERFIANKKESMYG
jgi:4-amino-4-deoxy-L-arabinose transferase-like glycosyltransferase